MAVKIVDEEDVANEVEILKELNHDNVVKYIGCLSNGNKYSIILELCMFSLADEIRVFKQGLPARKLHHLLKDFTIGYLHDKGISHFDIKPQNVLLGEDYRYKICDFGLSEKLRFGQSASTVGGSLPYAHPDVFEMLTWSHLHPGEKMKRHHITSIVDLWSIGIMIYEATTGHLPFKAYSKANLLFMMTNKPRAAISGCEDEDGFKFQKQLPPNCFANDQAENFVDAAKPLLKGLLQVSLALIQSIQDKIKNLHAFLPLPREQGSEGYQLCR